MVLEVTTVSRRCTSQSQDGWRTKERRSSADLNYLFYRQQVELSRARSAASMAAREAHSELAVLYERTIEALAGGGIRFGRSRGSQL